MTKFRIEKIEAQNVYIGNDNLLSQKDVDPKTSNQIGKTKKKRVPIPQITKIRAQLQKEIGSVCPLCDNADAAHFQIHHIDENPENNDISNLILVCPLCHSKINKGEISMEAVREAKVKSTSVFHNIEFVGVTLDASCNWQASKKNYNAFFEPENEEADLPVLNFSFVNHFKKTVVLKSIAAEVKHLPSGLSGIGPEPYELHPSAKYRLILINGEETNVLHLLNPLAIPSDKAFSFQVELCAGYGSQIYPIDGRIVARFTFHFSQNTEISIPPILFNCNSENEKMIIRLLN